MRDYYLEGVNKMYERYERESRKEAKMLFWASGVAGVLGVLALLLSEEEAQEFFAFSLLVTALAILVWGIFKKVSKPWLAWGPPLEP